MPDVGVGSGARRVWRECDSSVRASVNKCDLAD